MQIRTEQDQVYRLRPANKGRRIQREKRTIKVMLSLYCWNHHRHGANHQSERQGGHLSNDLCAECQNFLRYAHQRLDNCAFGELKSPCDQCATNCYSSKMRAQSMRVMHRVSSHMMMRYPILSLLYMLDKFRARRLSRPVS